MSISKSHLVVIVLSSLGFLALFSVVYAYSDSMKLDKISKNKKVIKSQKSTSTNKKEPKKAQKGLPQVKLASSSAYTKLPVADVETHRIQNSSGTVVLIPQSHKSPGSSESDKVNDKPTKAQKQIYRILEHIKNKFGVKDILAEGKIVNEDEKEKVASMKKLKEMRDTFARNVNKLKQNTTKEDTRYRDQFEELNQFIKKIDRKLYLAGAPYLLKANDSSIKIAGIEDKKLRQKSKKIVRNYLYQQDRIKDLKSNEPSNKLMLMSKKKKLVKLMELLQGSDNNSQAEVPQVLTKLDQNTAENSNIDQIIEDTKQSYNKIKSYYLKKQRETKLKDDNPGDTPSRANNPYDKVNDLEKLQLMHKKTEDKINEVIKDGRNVAVAENTADYINSNPTSKGILVFGAQHKEGVIKELNKQNLSVIVITPEIMR